MVSMKDLPNKPVLPTAPTSPNHYAPGPLRRHIGEPLGDQKQVSNGQRLSGQPGKGEPAS